MATRRLNLKDKVAAEAQAAQPVADPGKGPVPPMPGDPSSGPEFRAYMAGMVDMLQYLVTKVPDQTKSAILRHPFPPIPEWLSRISEVTKHVWSIESGSYSDYKVHGVYSTKAKAEAMLVWMNAHGMATDDGVIEERDLDEYVEMARLGYSRWDVRMHKNGDVISAELDDDDHRYSMEESVRIISQLTFGGVRVVAEGGLPPHLLAEIWARDREHAIKITNERRLIMIAENQWS